MTCKPFVGARAAKSPVGMLTKKCAIKAEDFLQFAHLFGDMNANPDYPCSDDVDAGELNDFA